MNYNGSHAPANLCDMQKSPKVVAKRQFHPVIFADRNSISGAFQNETPDFLLKLFFPFLCSTFQTGNCISLVRHLIRLLRCTMAKREAKSLKTSNGDWKKVLSLKFSIEMRLAGLIQIDSN